MSFKERIESIFDCNAIEDIVINEGIVDKVIKWIKSPKLKQKIVDILKNEVEKRFGTTNPEKIITIIAKNYKVGDVKIAAQKINDFFKEEESVVEDIVNEQIDPEMMASAVRAFYTGVVGGGLTLTILYMYIAHDIAPMDIVNKVVNWLR